MTILRLISPLLKKIAFSINNKLDLIFRLSEFMPFRNKEPSNRYGPCLNNISVIFLQTMTSIPNQACPSRKCSTVSTSNWSKVTEKFTLDKSREKKDKAQVSPSPKMEESSKECSSATTKTVEVLRYTPTAIFSLDSSWMAKNTVRDNSTGSASALKIQKMINLWSTTRGSGGEDCRTVMVCTKN